MSVWPFLSYYPFIVFYRFAYHGVPFCIVVYPCGAESFISIFHSFKAKRVNSIYIPYRQSRIVQ